MKEQWKKIDGWNYEISNFGRARSMQRKVEFGNIFKRRIKLTIHRMKILNLYAGIGGNRKLWGDDHDITAVEYNESIAAVYQDYFPNDKVIIADAHQYLLEHYKEFDFIWSSVPCQSHSRARFWASFSDKINAVYPDMKLYQEILLLKHYFKGVWIVENVNPYYSPLIEPDKKAGRHFFWSSFNIGYFDFKEANINRGSIGELEKLHGFDLRGYKFDQRKDQILRNCVHPETGKHILDCALGIINNPTPEQLQIEI